MGRIISNPPEQTTGRPCCSEWSKWPRKAVCTRCDLASAPGILPLNPRFPTARHLAPIGIAMDDHGGTEMVDRPFFLFFFFVSFLAMASK